MRTRFLFALLASLGLALFLVPARAEVPVDDTLLLDPFDPVPEIQFRHFGDNSCYDGCGYQRCDDGCGYHRCHEGCGYRRCHEGCHRERNRCERTCWHELGCGHDCWGDGERERYGYRDGEDGRRFDGGDRNDERYAHDHERFKEDDSRFNSDADRYEHQSDEYRHRYEDGRRWDHDGDGHAGREEERHEEHVQQRQEERHDEHGVEHQEDRHDEHVQQRQEEHHEEHKEEKREERQQGDGL